MPHMQTSQLAVGCWRSAWSLNGQSLRTADVLPCGLFMLLEASGHCTLPSSTGIFVQRDVTQRRYHWCGGLHRGYCQPSMTLQGFFMAPAVQGFSAGAPGHTAPAKFLQNLRDPGWPFEAVLCSAPTSMLPILGEPVLTICSYREHSHSHQALSCVLFNLVMLDCWLEAADV